MIYLYDGTETDFTYNGQPLPKARNTVVNYLINDEFFVTFQYPLDQDNVYKQIEKDKIVTVNTPDGMQPFRIISPERRANYVEVEAWPLFYADMRRKKVRPLSLRSATGHTAFAQYVNHLLIDTPFKITTNITEIHDYHTQDETERENNPNQLYDALEVFKQIVNRWNGEVIINGYDIRVVSRIGTDKEALLYEEKNIAEFVDKESMADLVTRLHGKSEWTEDGEDGEQIERSVQTTVDSPLINAYSGVIFEEQYTNNDIRTERELKNWLNLMFTTDNVDKPKRNIEVGTNVVDGQEINAGDGLVLKYLKHDVDMQIRMIGYRYDGFDNRYISINLGDAKESLTGSLKNSISNVENNVNNNVQQIAHTIINSMGQKLIYSETEPQGNFREGDTWFDNQGGMFFWDEERADWIPHPYNRRTDVVEQLLEAAQAEIATEKERIDDVVNQIDVEIANKFTSIDETISTVEGIANTAQVNAEVSLNHSLDAISDASTAISNAQSAIDTANSVQSLANDLSGQVSDFELTVDSFNQTINDYEGQVSQFQNDVAGLESTVANYEIELDEYGNLVDTYATQVSQFRNDVDGLNSAVTQYEIELDEYGNVVDSYATQVSQFQNTVNGLNSEIVNYRDDVQGYQSQVSSLENTVSGFNSTVQRVEASYDDLNDKVSSHTSSISNMDGRISANAEYIRTVDGNVQSLGASFDVVAGQVSSKAWNTDIKSAIDDIEVGGRNLIENSEEITSQYGSYSGATATEDSYDATDKWGFKRAFKIAISGGSANLKYLFTSTTHTTEPMVFGTDYTYSVYIENTGSNPFIIKMNGLRGPEDRVTINPNEWGRYSFTGVRRDDYNWFQSHITQDDDLPIEFIIGRHQLEKGSKATDWTPAPEDTLARFDHIETEWTQTFESFEQTVSSIDGRVTAQMQTIDRITDTVSDHTGRISTTERNINGLQDTVSDPVNGLVTQVSTLASGFNVLASDLEDMEVGGRNLLPLSNGNLKAYTPYNSSWFVEGTLIATSINSSANTLNLSLHEDNLSETLSEGEIHTISGFIRVNGQIPAKNIFINNRVDTHLAVEDILSFYYNPDTGFFVTTVPKARNSWIIHAKTELVLGDVLTIDKMKIEKGTIATDWTPAPEDMATQAQFSVLNKNINMRVSKNDVIHQINISTEGILIDGVNTHITNRTTIDTAVIKDAHIASITADKLTAGTINGNQIRVINLDFNTAVGNRTEFVQSAWNEAAGGNVQITGKGILTTASDSSQTYIQNGIVGTRNPSGATIGQIGYAYNDGRPWYSIQATLGSHFQIRMSRGEGSLNKQAFYIMSGGIESYINTDYIYMNPARYMTVQGVLNVQGHLNIQGGQSVYGAYGYHFEYGGSVRALSSNSTLQVNSSGGKVELRPSTTTVFAVDRTYGYMYRNLSMENNRITNQSDERLKENIADHKESSLDKIKAFNFVDFTWIKDGKADFGVIAQQVQKIAPELILEGADGYLSLDNSSLNMMTTHAIKELYHAHENTLELVSATYIGIEEHQETLDDHDSRIESLEKELEEANQKIEELERKVHK